jgi:hypothetical protein
MIKRASHLSSDESRRGREIGARKYGGMKAEFLKMENRGILNSFSQKNKNSGITTLLKNG